ncbi:hypothetical protein [Streptomyces sp. NPDC002133]|uniref:hypothetical protein n=1 Tax=Streptomyces sp. NPDC002133 TaxID=3154409 RepID=UPI0033208EF9
MRSSTTVHCTIRHHHRLATAAAVTLGVTAGAGVAARPWAVAASSAAEEPGPAVVGPVSLLLGGGRPHEHS